MTRAALTPRLAGSLPSWTAVYPEWWALALSVGAWAVMLTHGHASQGWALCLSRSPDAGVLDRLQDAWQTGALGGVLLGWVAMTLAMMPPLAIPLIRHVAARSFAVRRNRAIAGFLGGMVGLWLVIGFAALTVLGGVSGTLLTDPRVVAVGFLIAAAWQLAPMKRAALLRCHRTVPLSAMGWRADRDCIRYGLSHGLDCVASCWAMMLLALSGPVAGIAVQFIALAEQRARRPRLVLSAMAFVAYALVMLL
jgi:predicted metal-binding membrane protein